ncbi:MAG: mechanosensitive ion channel domain-containing protein [Bacteroidota bacterium]
MTLPSRAQNEATDPSDSIPLPQALPTSEIPKLIESQNASIQEIDQLAERPKFVDEVQEAIPDFIRKVDSSYAIYVDSTREYTYGQLDRAETFWSVTSKQAGDWSKKISERIRSIEAKRTDVQYEKQVALLTLESAREQEAPGEVLRSVQDVINQYDAQLSKLQQVVNKQLTIQTSITPAIAKINNGQAFLAKRREEKLSNLWQIHTDPIWSAQRDTVSVFKAFAREYKRDLNIAYNYVRENEDFRFFTSLVFLLLGGYLLFFKRRTQQLLKDKNEEVLRVRLLIKYPLLSALFITFVFILLALEPVSELNRLFTLVITVPTIYIFYAVSHHYRREQVWMFLVLIFYFELYQPLEDTYAGRVMQLLMNIGLLAVAINIITKRRFLVYRQQIRPYLNFAIQALAFLLFGSIMANIVGAMQLSRLLSNGVVVSLLVAVLFYLSVYVLTDIVAAVMINSPLTKSNIVKKHRVRIRQRAQRLFSVVAFFFWLNFTLRVFGISEMLIEGITNFVTHSIKVGTIAISLWDILAFILTLQISFWISRFIRFILDEEVYVRTKTEDKGFTGTISLLIRYGVISLGVILAFAAAGIEFDKLAILLGALGVGIGFGLQSIFNNLLSGVILALERPMKIGDVVLVKDLLGTVQDIGFRACIVRSFEGSDVIIPNGEFLSNEFVNWTRSDSRRRLAVNVGVAYGTDPELVLKLLRETADEHDVVLKYPSPTARFLEMGDSSLNFQLLYWIPDFDNSFSMGTQMHTLVYKKITEAGITIPFPQQDVYLHQADESIPSHSGLEQNPVVKEPSDSKDS